MIGLLIAETQRFAARRITKFFPLGLLGLIAVGVTIAYFVVNAEGAELDFVNGVAFSQDPSQPENHTTVLGPVGFLLPIMAFTLGASFFGADQKAGVIELLLTWQPQRVKLLAARVIGGSIVTAIIAAVLSALVVAAVYGLSAITGTTDGMTNEMWGWIATAVVRSGAMAGLFFVFGLGLTVVLNNSLASIIAFIIYAFVIESVASLLISGVGPWLPMTNAGAFVDAAVVFSRSLFDDGPPEIHHGYLTAGALVAAYVTVVLIAATLVFRRRDIT